MNGRWPHAGFTLIELMMATAILVFVMGVVIAVLIAGNRTVAVSQAQVSATTEARRGLEEMARELIQAPIAQITDESGATPWPPQGDWTGVRFRYPQGVDSHGAVNHWSSYVTYTLDFAAQQLIRTDEDGGTTRVMANGVTRVAFRQGDVPEEVWIELITQRTSTAGDVLEQPLGIRIRVRNE